MSRTDPAQRVWGVLADTLLVVIVLGIRWSAQIRGAPNLEQTKELPEWWWRFGSLSDWLLHPGPDAGLWAENARSMMEGHALDFNRLPVYLGLLSMAGKACGDIVFGGHLLNHCLSALVPLGIYALGRSTSGRAVGAGAAILTALSPTLLASKDLFGVDPCVQLVLVVLATVTWWARTGDWSRVVLAGILAGVAATTHYLCLLFAPMGVLLLTASDRKRKKPFQFLLSPLVATLAAGATSVFLMQGYADFTWKLVPTVYIEGLRSFGFMSEQGSLFTALADLLLQSPQAVSGTLQDLLAPLLTSGLPWFGLLGLFYLGIFGPGLRKGRGRLGDLRPGLWMLTFLLPLIALETVQAPERYRLYALPFIYLVVVRGIASALRPVDRHIRKQVSLWPRNTLAIACITVVVWKAWTPMTHQWKHHEAVEGLVPPLFQRGLLEREFGALVAATGRPLISRSSEVRFYAQSPLCLMTTSGPTPQEATLADLAKRVADCGGQVTYVLEELSEQGLGDTRQQATDSYVLENFQATHQSAHRDYRISLFLIEDAMFEKLTEHSPQ